MWIKDNQTYTTHSDIRQACPNTSFPSALTDQMIVDAGFTPVTELPAPSYDQATQRIEQTAQQEVDGVWTRGWTVVNLTPEQIEDARKSRVPQSISIRQACQALEGAGLLDDVEAAVAASPRYVQIDWERATSVDRTWPTLIAMQSALGLTDRQIDDLFVLAATL